jgi:S-DNA-T family DNA segregation ATPase FtsK/SpoIIIE
MTDPGSILGDTLRQFKIKAKIKQCRREGAFLVCDVALEPGGKVRQIERHSMEIALALRATAEPLVYPVPAEGIVRLELMMEDPGSVLFQDVVNSKEFQNTNAVLPVAIGVARNGRRLVVDLAQMPHLLVAGTTGSGKSMALHIIINSMMLCGSERVRLALIDPKRIEFSHYIGTPQLYAPIAKDAESSMELLSRLVSDMETRFAILQKAKCRDITQYRGRMPRVVVLVDEFAELMMASKRAAQERICRLAQKSRACGIHMVLATQRPSIDVVTGLIKANFPSRMSCQVSSAVDSRVVLDRNGAERLTGNGDAILDCPGNRFVRLKGAFLSEADIMLNVKHLASSQSWWKRMWGTKS